MADTNIRPRSGTAECRQAFVQAYITNGHNATQAAPRRSTLPDTPAHRSRPTARYGSPRPCEPDEGAGKAVSR